MYATSTDFREDPKMTSRALIQELTHGRDPWLVARRRVAGLAAVLATDFALIGMRQYGVIDRLPDLPLPRFDSNAVITSRAAYPFGVPDSTLALVGLGAIVALATAKGTARTGRTPALDVALGIGVTTGAAGALYYLDMMLRREKKLCAYCLVASTGMFALAAMALPGSIRAAARLFRRRRS